MSVNRIDQKFSDLKNKNKKAFISFVTAGDPDIATTEKIIYSLDQAGTDIIEIGIPFSDPIADGPVIQRAVQRSLSSGFRVNSVFKMVEKVRSVVNAPIVFMTYYNIVSRRGVKNFIRSARNCGADGLIVPDLPMEESGELISVASLHDFRIVMLTSPTTSSERLKKIARVSGGFVYHVSLTGVTGMRRSLPKGLGEDLARFRKIVKKPICVGFGVSGPSAAVSIARDCDGVIVGSALVSIIEKNLERKEDIPPEVGSFAKKIADAVHAL